MQSAGDLPIDRLSFYWRMTRDPFAEVKDIPVFLPFAFEHIGQIDLVAQKRNDHVLDCLRRAYLEAENVGYLQEGHALAASYGGDYLGFIKRVAGVRRTVFEIGCGGGYILRKLKEHGLTVTGIDPSPVAVEAGRRHGYEIIKSFYPPTPAFTGRADLILHYDVLEHVTDPVSFIRAHREHLTDGGIVAFAVPDCSESIANGDLSMIIHEHLNYFDRDSLARLLDRADFDVVTIERASHGGVLFCAGAPRKDGETRLAAPPSNKYLNFLARAESASARFRDFAAKANDDLGIYVPLRALPYLALAGRTDRLRFFDDDPGTHGKFLAGYAAPIENLADLTARPVRRVLVASFAFGDRIKSRIGQSLGKTIEIATLRDLLDPSSA